MLDSVGTKHIARHKTFYLPDASKLPHMLSFKPCYPDVSRSLLGKGLFMLDNDYAELEITTQFLRRVLKDKNMSNWLQTSSRRVILQTLNLPESCIF